MVVSVVKSLGRVGMGVGLGVLCCWAQGCSGRATEHSRAAAESRVGDVGLSLLIAPGIDVSSVTYW